MMTAPTPYYDPDLILEIYGKISTVVDLISSMRPLPFGQFATDSHANRNIVKSHRVLLADAAALKGRLYDLVRETAKLAIERRAG